MKIICSFWEPLEMIKSFNVLTSVSDQKVKKQLFKLMTSVLQKSRTTIRTLKEIDPM